MRFTPAGIEGAMVMDLDLLSDERGFFARSFSVEEFTERGLNPHVVQCSVSYSRTAGTLRGLHFQRPPYEEAKLVRCTAGEVHDVIVDLRPSSPTYGRHAAVRLSATNRRMLYVPEGCAHGFLTLADHTEIAYQMSRVYSPSHGSGVRWDDPTLGIQWPAPVAVIAERDRTYPDVNLQTDLLLTGNG